MTRVRGFLKRGAGVAAVTALGLLAACSGPPPAPTAPTTSTPTTSPQPSGASSSPGAPGATPVQLTMGTREGQNGALQPWWTGSSVHAEVPAGLPVEPKYRSEFFWNSPNGPRLRVGEGDRLRCRLQIGPHLGGTGADRDIWQVVWQLHGPNKQGWWPAPPLNLHVRGGSWRIGGGAGREDGHAEYYKPFTPFVDGKTVTWEFDILVSQHRDKARVDAWMDGAHVVKAWHPASGTMYPSHAWLTMKSGLYTGNDDKSRNSERRVVTFSPMSCDITRATPPAQQAARTAPSTPNTPTTP